MGRSLFRQSIWIYALTYFGAIGGYLTRVLMTQNYSPEEFGLFYAVLGLLGILAVFNDLGLTETLNYFGVKWYEDKKPGKLKFLVYLSIAIQSFTAILITIIMYLFREKILTSFFKVSMQYEGFFLIMLAFFLVHNIIYTLNALSNVIGLYEYSKINDAVTKILIVGSIILFVPLNQSLETMGYIWTLSFLAGIAFFGFVIIPKFGFLRKAKFAYSKKLLKRIFAYSTQVIVGSYSFLLMTKIDVIFLTIFIGVTSVGYYEVGLALANIMLILTTPLTSFMFPLTTKYIERGKKKELNSLLQIIYRFYFIIAMFLATSFFLFPKELILLMFGEKYIVVLTPFLVLTCAIFFQVFASLQFVILGGLGKVKERNVALYTAAGVNILLNLVLVQILGITGIAISTLCTLCVLAILTYRLIYKNGIRALLPFAQLKKQIGWMISAIVLFVISALLLKGMLTPLIFIDHLFWNSLIKTIIVATIGTYLYFGTLWYGKVFRIYPFAKHFGEKIQKHIPKWL